MVIPVALGAAGVVSAIVVGGVLAWRLWGTKPAETLEGDFGTEDLVPQDDDREVVAHIDASEYTQ